MVKKLHILFGLLFVFTANSIQAQVSVSASIGEVSGVYPTLADAFSKLNDGTHKGSIVITITENLTEIASASLDSSGNPTGSSYTSVTLSPEVATPITISGTIAGPLVVLNGADNVTINGMNAGGASLTIYNDDNGTSSCTVRFINDAGNNKILNTVLKGAGTSSTLGIIHFGTGTVAGNDGNKIADCYIDGTGLAATAVYSAGTSTSSDLQNSSDTIQNCRVFDFFNAAGSASTGVYLYSGNTGWYIYANSFYQTVARSTATQSLHTSVLIYPSWTTDAHIVKNNYSGGTAPGAINLLTYTGTSTNVVGYQGFNIQASGAGNMTEGNMVKNVTVAYSSASGSFSNTGFYAFVGGFDGIINFNNNTVDNFTVNNGGGSCAGAGIIVNGRVLANASTVRPTFNLTNNTISNLVFNAGGTGSCQFYGIRIDISSGASLIATAVANPSFNITGNSISNLSCATGGSTGYVRGIGLLSSMGTTATATFWPKATILNNTITNVAMNSPYAAVTSPTAVGISFLGYTTTIYTTDSTIISGNTISDIKTTNTAEISSLVAGIYVTNGLYGITRNKIYNLSNGSPGVTSSPYVVGINSRGIIGTGNTYIVNNFISLGKDNSGNSYANNVNYFGILNNFSTTRVHNIYYNTVVIDGTVTAGANRSACYHRGLETFAATANSAKTDLKNNIFINLRSGGTGSHYALSAGGGTNPLLSNYNNIYAANAATAGYWNSTAQTFAGFQTSSAGDANSKSVPVTFVNSSIADLHLSGASIGDVNLAGTVLTGYTTDIDGLPRSSSPYMGGSEAFITLPIKLLSFKGQLKSNNAILNWTTGAENNTAQYNLERSSNAANWTSIGNIMAKGNSTKNDYVYNDANLSNSKWYYRLKIIDKDGKYGISSVLLLELNNKELFSLEQNYPNPVIDATMIRYQLSSAASVRFEVYSLEGKKVASIENKRQDAGTYNIEFNPRQYQLSGGNYIYRLTATDLISGKIYTATKEMIIIK